MQLVGQICVHCRQRITREAEARVCPKCGSFVHNACAKRGSRGCRACGAPVATKTQATAKGPAAKDRGYNAILLGVSLMVLAIGGSTCAGAVTGDGQFVAAGVALVTGVALVLVGYLQNARR
jgi:hypothetical protein